MYFVIFPKHLTKFGIKVQYTKWMDMAFVGISELGLKVIWMINDIAEKLMSLCRLFADDISFSYSSHDELQIKSVIDHDLRELDEWSRKWLMCFHPNETEIMIFSNNTNVSI